MITPVFEYDKQRMAEILKNERRQRKLNQEEASRQIAMARTTLSAIESGLRPLCTNEFIQMVHILGYDLGELLKAAQPEATMSQIEQLLGKMGIPESGITAIMTMIQLLMETKG